MRQLCLFGAGANGRGRGGPKAFRLQLLKWVGNKQRFADEIVACFPQRFGRYYEPFVGSGAVLGTLSPSRAFASDACEPLIGIWQMVQREPELLASEYRTRWKRFSRDRVSTYETVKEQFNKTRNPADLFFCHAHATRGLFAFVKTGT